MNLSPSTRAELSENLLLVAQAVKVSDPGEDTALYELHAGLSRLMPTRPAEAGELAPVVTALGAPGVPKEAVELLSWLMQRRVDYPAEEVSVCVCAEPAHGYEVTLDAELKGMQTARTVQSGSSLAEAARAALEKVSR